MVEMRWKKLLPSYLLNMLLCVFISLAVPACGGAEGSKSRDRRWAREYLQDLPREHYPMAIVAAARRQRIRSFRSVGNKSYKFEKLSLGKSLEVIRLMGKMGADLNAMAEGRTPLIAAVQSGIPDMVALLLKHGADPLLQDQSGKTAMDYVGKHTRIKKLLDDALQSIYTQYYEISDPHRRIFKASAIADSQHVAKDTLSIMPESAPEPESVQQMEKTSVTQNKLILSGAKNNHEYDEAPQLIGTLKPNYPASAREAGIQGSVTLSVTVLPSGKAGNIMVIKGIQSGVGGLDEAAISAVQQATFKPAKKAGFPVQAIIKLSVPF